MAVEVNLRHERVLDPLTGLLNRTTLDGRFRELCAQALVAHEPVAMLLIDLDHFKRINDSSGHDAGDAVLREVAYELRRSLRAFEAAYRLGGEEFLVLLPGLDEPRAVEHAERLRRRIAASRPGGVAVTASIGLSAGAGDELVYERLFELADRRLYEAKHAGRDRVVPSPFAAAAPVRLAG